MSDRTKVPGERYDIAVYVGTERTPCGVIELFRHPDGTQTWNALSFMHAGPRVIDDERYGLPDREAAVRAALYEAVGVDVPDWVTEQLMEWRAATPDIAGHDWTSADRVSKEAVDIALNLALKIEQWLEGVPGGLPKRD